MESIVASSSVNSQRGKVTSTFEKFAQRSSNNKYLKATRKKRETSCPHDFRKHVLCGGHPRRKTRHAINPVIIIEFI
jgi:hypothetical protein